MLLGGYFPQRVDGTLNDDTLIYGFSYGRWQEFLALTDEVAAVAAQFFQT